MQPGQNAFNADLTKQQGQLATAWFSPSMYNIVKQNGRDVHLVVMPDPLCSVNSGAWHAARSQDRGTLLFDRHRHAR